MTTQISDSTTRDHSSPAADKPRGRKRRSAEPAGAATARTSEPESQSKTATHGHAPETDADSLKRYLIRQASTGAGISVGIHAVLLALLSLFVITHHNEDAPWLTSSFAADETANLDLTELEDFTLEPLAASTPIDVVSAVVPQPAAVQPGFLVAESPGPSGNASNTNGTGVRPPGTANAVTKGSFTAWTDPADPKPREDYLLVILVRVPDSVRKYTQEDLSGFLTGDDGYETPIGNFTGKGFPKQFYGQFNDKAHRLVIRVPGAAAKVRDTIQIRSRILREEQTLEKVF
jgi:hypothetical protein